MALSYTVGRQSVVGDLRYVSGSIDFDSAYATGGLAFDPGRLGMSVIDLILFSPTSGLMFEYDYTNNKVKAFFPTGGAGTPAAALAVPTVLASTGAVTASAVDATRPTGAVLPGVGAQVPASQNLATLTGVKFVAFGK